MLSEINTPEATTTRFGFFYVHISSHLSSKTTPLHDKTKKKHIECPASQKFIRFSKKNSLTKSRKIPRKSPSTKLLIFFCSRLCLLCFFFVVVCTVFKNFCVILFTWHSFYFVRNFIYTSHLSVMNTNPFFHNFVGTTLAWCG